MKAVGIKSLKNNLSRYLKEVQAGEVLLVTDRDQVIAEIRRPVSAVGNLSRWEAFLNDEERRGVILRAHSKHVPSAKALAELPRPDRKINLQNLLDELKTD